MEVEDDGDGGAKATGDGVATRVERNDGDGKQDDGNGDKAMKAAKPGDWKSTMDDRSGGPKRPRSDGGHDDGNSKKSKGDATPIADTVQSMVPGFNTNQPYAPASNMVQPSIPATDTVHSTMPASDKSFIPSRISTKLEHTRIML
ncbi:MAG: hypothetical protein M1816_004674 [Peltula sp. TS41687]|nr:MAG: hypothetical protein M1816_004674 [Peltula sp. TS41687]